MRIITAALFSLCTLCAQAGDVYMSRDANGNVVFSDQPSTNSQKHEVRELPSVPAFVAPAKAPVVKAEKPAAFTYTSLSIVSPQNGHQVASGYAGSLSVNGVLSPGLRESDTLVLLDNTLKVASGRQTAFSLSNLERGEHSLQMAVIDAQGNTLISSNSVTIFVQRPSVIKRSN
ncbi:DUF4124 domain-containing protein [Thalassolituus sp. LLYu03]|uniref:DUF4124 domain-containing protein n=1 Tax=Thalassolituus sp. LLYu03 TaxID=3421656 RepID=UPI003D27D5EF